jgi:hypothetical protein
MKVLTDPETWPEWQTEILATSGPVPLERGDEVEGRAKLLGFHVDGRSRTIGADGTSFVEDVIVGVRMQVSYDVVETNDGTRVTRRLTASLPGGLSGRVLSFFLKRRLKAMQKGVLEELVRHAEGL